MWTCIKKFPKISNDGQPAEVHEDRMPARFYRVIAVAGHNSVGEAKPAWALETGSGSKMHDLALAIAEAIAAGMIGLCEDLK